MKNIKSFVLQEPLKEWKILENVHNVKRLPKLIMIRIQDIAVCAFSISVHYVKKNFIF